jgi:hypothetical protein
MRNLVVALVVALVLAPLDALAAPAQTIDASGQVRVVAPLTRTNAGIGIAAAGAASSGVVTTGAQTIAGAKTFSGAAVFGSTVGVTGKITASDLIASTTSHTLLTWWLNAAAATGSCPATGTGCVGHVLPAQAFTLTGVTGYASVASGGGAANTVITVTDGTNTCTITIPCNVAPPAGTSTAGLWRIAAVDGAGTGCAFPASAGITASVTTAGCTATQPTLRNLNFVGKWQ